MKNNYWLLIIIVIATGIALMAIGETGCKKTDTSTGPGTATVPVLTTSVVTSITSSSAKSGGTITSDGGATITARGVCWSISHNPTVADNKSSDSNGTGNYISTLLSLAAQTPYFVRAYAINSEGVGYGNEVTFTTGGIQPGTVVDADGNVYHTVTIGAQQWLVENLIATHYRNGEAISTGLGKQAGATIAAGEYWKPYNSDSLTAIYGLLYNYYALSDARGIAPIGWRVASDSDWLAAASSLAPDSLAGGKLKEAGTAHWRTPNINATNESGFTALPGGAYNPLQSSFTGMGFVAGFWTSTADGASNAMGRSITNGSGYINRGSIYKIMGESVRCVKGE